MSIEHSERPSSGTGPTDTASRRDRVGPILFFHGLHDGRVSLAALLAQPAAEEPLALIAGDGAVTPETLLERDGMAVLRYTFSLPAGVAAAYTVDGRRYVLDTALDGDLRIAYVSCNGQERGDRERTEAERNALWRRLRRQHETRPFHLLLQGGDQLYADEMLDVLPEVRAWARGEGAGAVGHETLAAVRESLRSYLFARYLELYGQDEPARVMARIPSLCMWDDHDICDGWGSLPARQLDAAIGRIVFEVAREFFLLFQLGAHPDRPPPICPDTSGRTLTWAARLPGVAFVAPDLRSERRPDRIMGTAGHAAFRDTLDAAAGDRVFVLSSVPALGPRLSWVEAVLRLRPGVHKYEDDLRDQWQSRAHRDEWRAFLRRMLGAHERGRVTVLSGEIHLATRAIMAGRGGPLHQLVASGVAHPPPPKAYTRTLGALARLGESPLPGHPIRLRPLPGQAGIYTPQRNYLVLERSGGRWQAHWELEHDGASPALSLEA